MNFLKINDTWKSAGGPVKTSPIQASELDDSVPRVVAEKAYKEYQARYGSSQSLDRLEERGGFGSSELAILLFQHIQRLEGQVAIDRKRLICACAKRADEVLREMSHPEALQRIRAAVEDINYPDEES